MSLRNELRQPLTNLTLFNDSYNWRDWYLYSKQGAQAVHAANPALLVFLSGLDSDTIFTPVVRGTELLPGTGKFSFDDFGGYADKLVLELHNYANILGTVPKNCSALMTTLSENGFEALSNTATNRFPVVMSEFGFPQDATTWKELFASCLEGYLPAQNAGWMIWAIAGSYYIREGAQDSDETWGLLTHDWSAWRSPEHINGGLVPMVKASLSFSTTVPKTSPSPTGGSPGSSTSTSTNVSGKLRAPFPFTCAGSMGSLVATVSSFALGAILVAIA